MPLLRMSSRCSNLRKLVYVVDPGDTPGSPGGRGRFESLGTACSSTETSAGYNADVVEGYIWRGHLPNSGGETAAGHAAAVPPPPRGH